MSLPEQLQKQVDQAEAIAAQFYGSKEGESSPESAATETPAEAAATETTEQAASQQTAAPQQREDENSETYAQRWRSLQGVYNATASKARELETRAAQLESLLTSLQNSPQPQQQIEQRHLREADTETFGADMVDFAKRAAKEEVAPLVSAIMALRDEVSALKGVTPVVNTLVANQRMSAQERFFQEVAVAVPDWQSINNDGKFHDWLLTPDPMTGITRQAYLADAQRLYDAPRAANIFNIWKQVSGVVPAAREQSRAQPNKAANELERQVAPGRASAAPVQTREQARMWSTDDITKFYADVRNGKYRSREAERAELERDIFLAQRDGRIQRSAA